MRAGERIGMKEKPLCSGTYESFARYQCVAHSELTTWFADQVHPFTNENQKWSNQMYYRFFLCDFNQKITDRKYIVQTTKFSGSFLQIVIIIIHEYAYKTTPRSEEWINTLSVNFISFRVILYLSIIKYTRDKIFMSHFIFTTKWFKNTNSCGGEKKGWFTAQKFIANVVCKVFRAQNLYWTN